MSHAATVVTPAAKKQNQDENDQKQFHDKLHYSELNDSLPTTMIPTTTKTGAAKDKVVR
jgi:hypothetical protein